MAASIELKVNGIPRRVETDPRRSLLDVLRDDLDLTGCEALRRPRAEEEVAQDVQDVADIELAVTVGIASLERSVLAAADDDLQVIDAAGRGRLPRLETSYVQVAADLQRHRVTCRRQDDVGRQREGTRAHHALLAGGLSAQRVLFASNTHSSRTQDDRRQAAEAVMNREVLSIIESLLA